MWLKSTTEVSKKQEVSTLNLKGAFTMKRRKAALTACSDPRSPERQEEVSRLCEVLEAEGLEIVENPDLFLDDVLDERIKAEALNRLFRNPEIEMIFDISGGDLANSVLPYLDYEAIQKSRALFFGFSDLTTVLNAIHAKTGKEVVNYQVRYLLYDHASEQIPFFREQVLTNRFSPDVLQAHFLRGSRMQGKILGGNIRCFLKLAGTPYWPDLCGSILLLESLGGGPKQMITAVQQYKQMGVFDQVSGILLGTFSKMEDDQAVPDMKEIVLRLVPENIPVAETRFVGHRNDARAVILGREMEIEG